MPLILGVNQDKAFLSGNLGATLEELQGVTLQLVVVFLADEARADNLLAADVLVMAFVGLSGGGDDGRGELLVLDHALGQLDAAEGAGAGLILAPGAAGEVAANNHLHAEPFALESHGDHGIGSGELPVGQDVGGGVEELGGNLVEHLTLVGDALGENDIKGGDAVAHHHGHILVVDVVDIAHFAHIEAFLLREIEVGFYYCFHIIIHLISLQKM